MVGDRPGERRDDPSGGKAIALDRGAMLALLGILAAALLVGRLARQITPAVEIMLLGLIATIVLAEFASWHYADTGGPLDLLRALVPGLH